MTRRSVALLVGAVALAATAAVWFRVRPAGPADVPAAGPRPDVILVTIDTLRADRLRPDLMPAVSALAARGLAFVDARTVAPLTLPSHASLMTGLVPPRTGVRLNGVHRLPAGTVTLATVLRGAGYRTAAFIGAFVLDRRFGLAAGFETYDDEIARPDPAAGRLEAERRGDQVADRAIAWLRTQDVRAPLFVWVHLFDPHAPYEPPEEWVRRAGGVAYDGEVAFADAQVARLLDAVRQRGGLDRAIIVVAGDHGESLGEHGEATHGLLLYDGALRVPLVMAGPGIEPMRRLDAVSLVDVAPTVLGRVGVAAPAGLDGRDMHAARQPGDAADLYAETMYPEAAGCSALRMVYDGRWKYIGGPSRGELYDLAADPGERVNLADTRVSLAAAMDARAAAQASTGGAPASAAVAPEAAERLRALGYVSAAPQPGTAPGPAPSPVTVVQDWGRLEAALADLGGGHRARGLSALAILARARPDALAFQSAYAQALTTSGDPADALRIYRRMAARWPTDVATVHGLAAAARDAGRADEAMAAEQAALALDADFAPAVNGLGLLHADAGRTTEARATFARAVTLDPHAVSYWCNLGNASQAAGDLPAAEDAFTRALRLDPSSADGANGLAVVYVRTGRAGEAVVLLERLVALAPSFPDAWLNLGIARQERGDRSGAAEAYRQVQALGPRARLQAAAARQLLSTLGNPR